MSWDWIQERAKRASERPGGINNSMSLEEKKVRHREVAHMQIAAARKMGKRMVNIFGADHVPVCAGVYSFTSEEGGVTSNNELTVDWPFTPASDEFIDLDEEFDTWANPKTGSSEAPAAQGSVS